MTVSRSWARHATRIRPASTTRRESAETTPLYVWCLLASLVCSMFSGFSSLLHLPLPPDRIFFAGALVLLLLDPHTERLRWRGVYAVMLVLVAWTGWSILTHGGLRDTVGAFAFLDRIIVPFLMFCLGPLVFTTTKRRDLLLRTMTLVGIYLGFTAVFELFGPHALVWPSYIMDPNVGILFGRARGPFAGAEANGMTMAISLLMAGFLFSRSRGAWRWISAVGIAATSVGVVLCLTRSIWIATIIAVIAVASCVPTLRRRLPGLIVAVVAVFLLVLVAVPDVGTALSERLSMKSSIYDRQNTNAAGLRVVAAHPITGVGWQQFVHVVDDWVRQDPDYPVSNIAIEVHNVFLSRAAETGIPGSVLWILAVLGGPVSVALGLRRRELGSEAHGWTLVLIGTLVIWLVPSLTSPNPYPLPNDLMWLVAGIAGRSQLMRGAASSSWERTPTGQPDAVAEGEPLGAPGLP